MDLTGSQPTSLSSHQKRPQRPCPPPQLIAHFLRLAEGLSPSLTLHRLAIPISQNPTTCSASRHSDLPDPRSSIFPSLFPSSIVQVKKKKAPSNTKQGLANARARPPASPRTLTIAVATQCSALTHLPRPSISRITRPTSVRPSSPSQENTVVWRSVAAAAALSSSVGQTSRNHHTLTQIHRLTDRAVPAGRSLIGRRGMFAPFVGPMRGWCMCYFLIVSSLDLSTLFPIAATKIKLVGGFH
ncbi:hypothetical protein HDK90DRAFT_271078 [Phyllosticta capitalensis]|uniref:Uncharacterized protein n=1 Tax=Phyllosticta capitalensis TaxID=121624 RepID=A0ABR1YM53_9PEZI